MATTNKVVEFDYAYVEVATTKARNKWALTLYPKDGEQAEKYVIGCDRYDLDRCIDEVYFAWMMDNI